MRIFVPSYNRAGKTTIQNILPLDSFSFVVPESQRDYYLQYSDNVITIPDERDGNGGSKRNAIIDLHMREGEMAWFADDDVKKIVQLKKDKNLQGDELVEHMERLANMSDDAGALMCGFSINVNDLYYHEGKPFSLIKPVYVMFGLRKCKLRYDESLKGVTDTDYCIRVLWEMRWKILRDNRLFVDHSFADKGKGGLNMNKDERLPYIQMLKEKWGGIVKTDAHGNLKPIKTPKGV